TRCVGRTGCSFKISPPAGTLPSERVPGCVGAGVAGGLWFGVVGCGRVLSPRPGTGGNQEPAGRSSGGGLRWSLILQRAACPGRTLIGLRLPDRGERAPGLVASPCRRESPYAA